MTLWVRRKKPVKSGITLDPKNVEVPQDISDNTGDNYINVEMPFNSLMAEFFKGSYIEKLMQHMFANVKPEVKNPEIPKIVFTLHQIMYLHINFHKLALTRGSFYTDTELPEWKVKKKAVINPKITMNSALNGLLFVVLHHEDIKYHLERISLLQYCDDQ